MFNAKYIGFDKYNKGSINLTCCALGHGAIPSLEIHCHGQTWGHFSWIFSGISRDIWDCFLQEFRGDFLVNSRSWLKITNLTGKTDP